MARDLRSACAEAESERIVYRTRMVPRRSADAIWRGPRRTRTLSPSERRPLIKRWESKIGERTKLSSLLLAGHVEFGGAKRFIHISAYESPDQRTAIR